MQKVVYACGAVLCLGLSLTGNPAARADQKVVMEMTIDNPQMKAMLAKMPDAQRKKMASMGMGGVSSLTVYSSGNKVKLNATMMTMIVDAGTKSVYMLNPQSHTYNKMPYRGQGNIPHDPSVKVVDTGQTKVILGHRARHYTVSMNRGQGSMKGDLWAATDMQKMVGSEFLGGGLGSLVKGFPLDSTMVSSGGRSGTMTIRTKVKSISTSKLPGSTFAIPAGYKAASMGAPGMGMKH